MGKINVLDYQVANLIAAGEVVDRPASVIKELMENSIDAGATAITVEIKNGGISFMRVTDNGCGMSREDVALSIKRHATSKIKEAKDLDGIITLGFRGEALAAISSVSNMRIMTRQKGDKVGTVLSACAGEITDIGDISGREGTTVIVEQLFYNVPARRKFLKKDTSEALAIAAVVEKIALSRPDIAIKFISDGSIKLETVGDGKLFNVIYSIYGRDFAKKLCTVNYVTDGIEVTGYIGTPNNVRANRNYQNFFINGRYIKTKTGTAALEQAFSSYMEAGKFPCCVLNIVIHPAFVDVNVHPTKLEVKFSNEKSVFDAIYCAVKNALLSITERPEMLFEKKHVSPDTINAYNTFVPVYDRLDTDHKPEQQTIVTKPYDDLPFLFEENEEKAPVEAVAADIIKEVTTKETEKETEQKDGEVTAEEAKPILNLGLGEFITDSLLEKLYDTKLPSACDNKAFQEELNKTATEPPQKATPQPLQPKKEGVQYKYIGLAFSTYIIVEYDNKLLMIDKHAAHERIIFEEMKKNMKKTGNRFSQLLIVPFEIKLSADEFGAVYEYEREIKAVGFDFDLNMKKNSVSIVEIPGGLEISTAADMFYEIADRLSTGTGDVGVTRNIIFEQALYQASCKAAIKAGTNESEEHLKYICDRLFSYDDIFFCPHGRPVAFEIPKNSIEHQFKRS